MNILFNTVFWLAMLGIAACGCYFASFGAASVMVKILPALQGLFHFVVVGGSALLTTTVSALVVIFLGSRS